LWSLARRELCGYYEEVSASGFLEGQIKAASSILFIKEAFKIMPGFADL